MLVSGCVIYILIFNKHYYVQRIHTYSKANHKNINIVFYPRNPLSGKLAKYLRYTLGTI